MMTFVDLFAIAIYLMILRELQPFMRINRFNSVLFGTFIEQIESILGFTSQFMPKISNNLRINFDEKGILVLFLICVYPQYFRKIQ
jgi:hypothetical protein